jgi:hypothetical protein
MDFFGEQAKARATSGRLVFGFALAVLGIVVAVYAAAATTLVALEPHAGFWQPGLFAVVAAGTALVVLGGAGFQTLQLRSGGDKVAGWCRSRPTTRTNGGCATSSRRWRSRPACRCRRSTCSTARRASTRSLPAGAPPTPPSR